MTFVKVMVYLIFCLCFIASVVAPWSIGQPRKPYTHLNCTLQWIFCILWGICVVILWGKELL